MIGKVIVGSSFYHCISYCLEDKKTLIADTVHFGKIVEQLQHKDRAEVLFNNRCEGDKYELTTQFEEVRHLSRRVEKPVLHLTLRLAPGDNLDNSQWIEATQLCAAAFDIADHQYVCVLHKDTQQPHIHIVANRVGFDGKVVSDSNSYRKMAEVCRKLENHFGLTKVLSPRTFLPPSQRMLPRHDKRKTALGKEIWQVLQKTSSYREFEEMLKMKGIAVIKGRGIVFLDQQKMKVKGSELGFSLATIQKLFQLKAERERSLLLENAYWSSLRKNATSVSQRLLLRTKQELMADDMKSLHLTRAINHLLDELLRPGYAPEYVFTPFESELKKQKKKRKNL